MSAIVEIQERIQNTVARIAEYEKAVAWGNGPPSLLANIRALEKLKASLEQEFEKFARNEEVEICRYRLLPREGERPAITAIAKAWIQYQALFSSVYDVVKHGPKQRRTSKESLTQTEFAFGYTFSGSIGIVLTLPARGNTYSVARDLEKTTQTIFEMAKTQTTEGLSVLVERLGVSPVMKLGAWIDAHVAFGAGAGVEWELSQGPLPQLLIQVQEFEALKLAMDKISEPTELEETVSGLLLMADMDKRTFRMKLDSGERIAGTFDEAISLEQKARLPERYSAVVKTTTTIKPAIEKKDTSRFLVRLLQQLHV